MKDRYQRMTCSAARFQLGHRVIATGLMVLASLLAQPRAVQAGNVDAVPSAESATADSQLIERGAYLARLGNCHACHTVPGKPAFSGGRAIRTDYGTFYSPNITPDQKTGLGSWTLKQFRIAIREGWGKNGEPLYPVFPYDFFTRLADEDVDALYHYLQSIPAEQRVNREHDLRFPWSSRMLLHVWRAFYFRSGRLAPDESRDRQWSRGAYLIEGLAHCDACHRARNFMGALDQRESAGGGRDRGWAAPALDASAEAGVMDWSEAEIVELLGTGKTDHATTLGPMAEIVFESLQHATPEDLQSMARYLKSKPDHQADKRQELRGSRLDPAAAARSVARGKTLYAEHCADCHGDAAQGRPPAAPALRNNRALAPGQVSNAIRVVLYGAFAPGTRGNPFPFGMPPFNRRLDDRQIADILNFLIPAAASNGQNVPEHLIHDFTVQRQRTLEPG